MFQDYVLLASVHTCTGIESWAVLVSFVMMSSRCITYRSGFS